MGYSQDRGNKTQAALPLRKGGTMITVQAFAIALSVVFLLLVLDRIPVS